MDAHAWDERYAAVDQVWSATPNQFVAEALADLPAGDALDLACGEGRNAIWLARRGWRVTAVDFSAVAVERGRSLAGHTEVDWRVGDALSEPVPDVDLALLAYLQLPDDERSAAVRRAWEAVRAGGHLFVVAHDRSNLTEGTGGPKDPAVLYTAEDVLADLGGAPDGSVPGAEVLRAERVGRTVTAEDEHGGAVHRTAWDALVHLRRR